MAKKDTAFFDNKGAYFKTPDEATISDIAYILGKIGDSDGPAYGLAKTIFENREKLELAFAEYDVIYNGKVSKFVKPL